VGVGLDYGTIGKWYFLRRWSGVTSTASIAAGTGGIYIMMDERGAITLYSIVVVLTKGLSRVMRISTLKMGRRYDGGGGFSCVFM
jgi:hypothetical protein